MEGIEKITARIIEDAEREIAQMQRENEEKINALTAEAQAVAEQESLELLTRGRRAAEERRERPVIFGGGGVSQDGIGS